MSWCCALCGLARVWRAEAEEAGQPAPTLATIERFAVRFDEPGSALPPRFGSVRIPHGPIWHKALGLLVGAPVDQIEAWCRAPDSITLARSRAIAEAAGVPLNWLRARIDVDLQASPS